MGVARLDGQVQESQYFLAGPRKFCITIIFIYNIFISENEGCRQVCRPIKVRPLTIVQTPNFAERAVLGGGG